MPETSPTKEELPKENMAFQVVLLPTEVGASWRLEITTNRVWENPKEALDDGFDFAQFVGFKLFGEEKEKTSASPLVKATTADIAHVTQTENKK